MLSETVRLVAAFLDHPEHGVNGMIASLPRKNLGGAADDPAPPLLPIFNTMDSPTVAERLDPPEVPAIVVWGDSTTPIELRGYKTAREAVVAIAFVTADDADPIAANRVCSLALRGVVITMGRYDSQSMSTGYRELNGIKVHAVRKVVEEQVGFAVGSRKLWGFVDARLIVVETYI